MQTNVELGDVVKLKKPHPCGSYDWEVIRLGAVIGLRCKKCRHRIMLERSEFERRVNKIHDTKGKFEN